MNSRKSHRKPQRGGLLLQSLPVLFILLATASGAGAHTATPIPTIVTDGPINAIVRTSGEAGDTLLGGNFTCAGNYTGGGAPVGASDGQVADSLPGVNGQVLAVIPDGEVGWYIGGTFTKIGSFERSYVARLTQTGAVAPDWRVTLSGQVQQNIPLQVKALALSSDKTVLYVGGSFTSVNGETQKLLVGLNASNGQISERWQKDKHAGNAGNVVNALLVRPANEANTIPETVFVGGDFTSLGNPGNPNATDLLALRANGEPVTPWTVNLMTVADISSVNALALDNSRLFVGGTYDYSNQNSKNIIALEPNTGAVQINGQAWTIPTTGGDVLSLVAKGDTLYVGGFFGTIGVVNPPRAMLAAIRISTKDVIQEWNPLPSSNRSGTVNTLAVTEDRVYVGGSFSAMGSKSRLGLASVNTSNGEASDEWQPLPCGGGVRALAVNETTVFVGGTFQSLGAQKRLGLARLSSRGNLRDWKADVTSVSGNTTSPGTVKALAVKGNSLYVGGSFTNVMVGETNSSRKSLAALNLETGTVVGWNPGNNINAGATVNTIVPGTGNEAPIYVGGDFENIGASAQQTPVPLVAALGASLGDPTSWRPSFTGPASGNKIKTILLNGERVYLGGQFTIAPQVGSPITNLAAFKVSDGSLADGWNNAGATGGTVDTLLLMGENLYVGGSFTSIAGNSPPQYLAALKPDTGEINPFNARLEGTVSALAADSPLLFACGSFTRMFGETRNYCGTINTSIVDVESWNPNFTGTSNVSVNALVVDPENVYTGGSFSLVGGEPMYNYAQFSAPLAYFGSVPETVMEGGGPYEIGIELSSIVGEEATVQYTVAPGGTAISADYTLAPASIRLEKGQRSATLQLRVTDDNIVNPGKSLTITLNSATNVLLGENKSMTLNITDNDTSAGGTGGSGGSAGGSGGSGGGTRGGAGTGGSTTGTGGSGGTAGSNAQPVGQVNLTALIDSPLNSSTSTQDVSVQFSTNLAATCTYSLDQGTATAMTVTGGTTHTQVLLGLTYASHTLDAKCSDTNGKSATATTTWTVSNSASASTSPKTEEAPSAGAAGGCSCSIKGGEASRPNLPILLMVMSPILYPLFRGRLVRALHRKPLLRIARARY